MNEKKHHQPYLHLSRPFNKNNNWIAEVDNSGHLEEQLGILSLAPRPLKWRKFIIVVIKEKSALQRNSTPKFAVADPKPITLIA